MNLSPILRLFISNLKKVITINKILSSIICVLFIYVLRDVILSYLYDLEDKSVYIVLKGVFVIKLLIIILYTIVSEFLGRKVVVSEAQVIRISCIYIVTIRVICLLIGAMAKKSPVGFPGSLFTSNRPVKADTFEVLTLESSLLVFPAIFHKLFSPLVAKFMCIIEGKLNTLIENWFNNFIINISKPNNLPLVHKYAVNAFSISCNAPFLKFLEDLLPLALLCGLFKYNGYLDGTVWDIVNTAFYLYFSVVGFMFANYVWLIINTNLKFQARYPCLYKIINFLCILSMVIFSLYILINSAQLYCKIIGLLNKFLDFILEKIGYLVKMQSGNEHSSPDPWNNSGEPTPNNGGPSKRGSDMPVYEKSKRKKYERTTSVDPDYHTKGDPNLGEGEQYDFEDQKTDTVEGFRNRVYSWERPQLRRLRKAAEREITEKYACSNMTEEEKLEYSTFLGDTKGKERKTLHRNFRATIGSRFDSFVLTEHEYFSICKKEIKSERIEKANALDDTKDAV